MTIQRVLVGVDGSPAGTAALHFAAKVAEGARAELTAATAVDPPASALSPDLHDEIEAEQRAALPDVLIPTAVATIAPIRHVMRQGRAQDVLTDVGDEIDADLVVVGRTGLRSRPGPLHIASVPEQLAHHTTRPLAVIPTGTADLEQVVVGVTPSTAARHALDWSAGLVDALAVPLHAVNVRQPPTAKISMSVHDRSAGEKQLDRWVQSLRSGDRQVDTHLVVNVNERSALLAQLSMVGRLGVVALGDRGRITEVRAGGSAMYLLHRSTQPIVLVPATSDSHPAVPGI